MYSTIRFPHVPGSRVSLFGCYHEGYRRSRKWRRTIRRVTGRRAGQEFWGEEARDTAAGRPGEEGEVRMVDTRYVA